MNFLQSIVTYSLASLYGAGVVAYYAARTVLNPGTKFWHIKKREKPPACLLDPELGTHHYADLKGIKLHYVQKGDQSKPLMVFVHGFPEFWYSWRHQIKEFSRDYWVVAYDMRGYGYSDKPSSVRSYSREFLVEDLKQLVNYLGKEKFTLVAHDWGGMVAWYFLLKYGGMVENYIMMDTGFPGKFFKSYKQFLKSWYMFFFQLPYLPEMVMRAYDMELFRKGFIEDGTIDPEGVTDDDIEAYKFIFQNKEACTAPINYYRAGLQKIRKGGSKKSGKKIPLPPGLFLFSDNDAYLEHLDILDEAKSNVPNLKTAIINGGNHFIQQAMPKEVNREMRNFLNNLS